MGTPYVAASTTTLGGFDATRTISTSSFSGYVSRADDLVLLFCNINSKSAVISLAGQPAWTNLHPSGGDAVAATDTNAGILLSHVVTPSEASAGTQVWTLTNLFTANQSGRQFLVVVRGSRLGNPVDRVDVLATVSGGGSNLLLSPVVTPGVTGGIMLMFGGPDNVGQSIDDSLSSWITLLKVSGGATTQGLVARSPLLTAAGVSNSGYIAYNYLGGVDESVVFNVVVAPPSDSGGIFACL